MITEMWAYSTILVSGLENSFMLQSIDIENQHRDKQTDRESFYPSINNGAFSCLCVYREALRWTLFSMQATGHVLLGTSYYMQHLIDEDEKAEAQLTACQNTNKPLQAIQWKKTAADHKN